MSLKEKFAKIFFRDVIEAETKKNSNGHISHVDPLTPLGGLALANEIFGKLKKTDFSKSSKQVVTHRTGPGTSEGILPDIDFEIFNQMYEQTSWVRAVVGVIRKAVTARGYSLVPNQPNADPANAETLKNFFANANPNDTFIEMLDDVTRDVYVFGNAFLEVVHGIDGKPKELWNLDATTMRVKADDHGAVGGYVQAPRFASGGKSSRVDFEFREVIHFKLGTKGATLYGLSPLTSLILPITVDKFAQIYNRAFFLNGAKIRGAFIMKDATPEQVERNREYLQTRAANPDMAHSDMVLEGQIEFKQVGVNQKDMEFLELREFTRNEILAVYGVPPSKVSIIETGNIGSGTGEHQTQTFYEETILPFQMRVAEKITKHIIRKGFGINDWNFQFNKRSIDDMDQANIFNIYLQNGVLSADEVRSLILPRMPEIQKIEKTSGAGYDIVKGKLDPRQTIVESTRTVVALENRFVRAMERLFRDIKDLVSSQIPAIVRQRVLPQIHKIEFPFESYVEPFHDIGLKKFKIPETAKGLDDLEVILELIDEGRIAEVVERFSIETAKKGAQTAARRSNLGGIDDISLELEEILRNNALDLARNIGESIKGGLRQSLIEGLANNETVAQMTHRIENQLENFATVQVRPVTDAQGNVIRQGISRQLSRGNAAEIIARTEANRAYNEANLDALRQAEVTETTFLLASDACPQCRAISESLPGEKLGKTFSIDAASGVIPVHPNCRCTWVTQ